MPSAVWQGFSDLLRPPPSTRAYSHAPPPLPEALSAPRHVPGALQGVQDAQDGFQDGPGRPPKPPRWPKMPPRRPKRPQRSPKSAPRGPPRGPKEAKIIDFHCVFQCFSCYRLFELPTLQDGSRGPQERPKTSREAPKRVPRRPKRASKRPKRRPRQPKIAPRQPQERSKRRNIHPQFGPCARRGPQETPRGLREAPREPQEAPKRRPNSPQEASKLPPRSPREASHDKYPNDHPRCLRCPLEQSPPSMLDWHGGGTCRGQLDIFREAHPPPTDTSST